MMETGIWGIDEGYEDALGVWRSTPAATRLALLAAMGVDPDQSAPPPEPLVRVIRSGQTLPLEKPAELRLEDGSTSRIDVALPPDLPFGYHELRPLDGGATVRIIASPGQCYLPAHWRTWGWAVQLYALRSAESWGVGDLSDLRRLGRWSATDLGAGSLLTNPLHAATPVIPQQPSPYFPSSRRFRNVLYVRIEEVPSAAESGVELDPLATAARALNRQRFIDRDAIFRLGQDWGLPPSSRISSVRPRTSHFARLSGPPSVTRGGLRIGPERRRGGQWVRAKRGRATPMFPDADELESEDCPKILMRFNVYH
jgi:4-alpha-glucanotransferase